MLKTRLPAALKAIGFSDAEVAHTMRIDGPLDIIRHRMWCDACNRGVEATLRELLANNAACKCGGHFHIGSDKDRDVIDEIVGRLVPNSPKSV